MHIQAKGLPEACEESLGLLIFLKWPGMCEQVLEAILIISHRGRQAAGDKLAQRVGMERWPETEINELLEAVPGRSALILLHLRVPLLCRVV